MRLTFLLILIGLQLFDLPAWSQSASEKLDRLLERIESTESYLQDLKITPNIQSQEQNPINEQVSKPVPALESPSNFSKKNKRSISSPSRYDQLLNRIEFAESQISALRTSAPDEDLPSLPDPEIPEVLVSPSPAIEELGEISPVVNATSVLKENNQKKKSIQSSTVESFEEDSFNYQWKKSNQLRVRFSYLYPFDSDYIHPGTGTSLPLSYDSGHQLALEYLFGSSFLSLGTSVLWSESNHHQLESVPIEPQGRSRSFGGSILLGLNKDIHRLSLESILSIGLTRRLDEYRFDTEYFSEAGVCFLYALDLGLHYHINESYKLGLFWKYQNISGLNRSTDNQTKQIGISLAKEF